MTIRHPGQEKLLLLNIAPASASAMLLKIDEDRTVELVKDWKHFDAAIFRARFQFSQPKVVISFDPALVFNVVVPLKFVRQAKDTNVSRLEMESLLQQSLTGLSNEYRGTAAKALNVDELHVVLVDARLAAVSVEGKEVVTPVGSQGKTIESVMELSFTTRTVFEDWQGMLGQPESVICTDGMRAKIGALEKVREKKAQLLLVDRAYSTFAESERLAHKPVWNKTTLKWSLASLWRTLSAKWNVPQEAAIAICAAYVRGEVSLHVGKMVEKMHEPWLQELERELRRLRLKNEVCIVSVQHLPLKLPLRCGNVVLEEPPAEDVKKKFGYRIGASLAHHPPGKQYHILAAVWEFYHGAGAHGLNRWLHQKLHWLQPRATDRFLGMPASRRLVV